MDVLDPPPVRRRLTREAGTGGEAAQFVAVVVGFSEPVLVPHRVRHHPVKPSQPAAAVAEFGVLERVTDLDLAFQIVDDHVHVRHRPGFRHVFLAVELQRRQRPLSRLGLLFHGDFALHQQPARAAAGVVDLHARLRLQHLRHDRSHLPRCVELAGALAAAFGELADQVFVALADDVGLHILQAQPLDADRLDQVREPVIIEVALAVGGGVEVHPVDDPLQQRVLAGNRPQLAGHPLADPLALQADHAPHRLLRILRPQWQVEAHQLPVGRHQLERLLAAAHRLGDAVEFIVEHITQPLGEDQRQDVVLVFRRILGAADRAGRIPDPAFQRFVLWFRRLGLAVAVGSLTRSVAIAALLRLGSCKWLHRLGSHQADAVAAAPAERDDPPAAQSLLHGFVGRYIPAQLRPQHRVLDGAAGLLQGLSEVLKQLLIGHRGAGWQSLGHCARSCAAFR